MWRYSDRTKPFPEYPAPFSQMFGDFGSNVTRIDAVYERPHDGNIVFFSGDLCEYCYNRDRNNLK
jgi:hypothetical protein